jgi:hypothetical protein
MEKNSTPSHPHHDEEAAPAPVLPAHPLTPLERRAFDTGDLAAAMALADDAIRRARRTLENLTRGSAPHTICPDVDWRHHRFAPDANPASRCVPRPSAEHARAAGRMRSRAGVLQSTALTRPAWRCAARARDDWAKARTGDPRRHGDHVADRAVRRRPAGVQPDGHPRRGGRCATGWVRARAPAAWSRRRSHRPSPDRSDPSTRCSSEN